MGQIQVKIPEEYFDKIGEKYPELKNENHTTKLRCFLHKCFYSDGNEGE